MTTFVPQFLYILLTVIGGAYSLDADADLVKRSNSGLCHPPNSRWHERTKHYDAFDSLQACLESGGELPRGIKQTAHHSAHKPSDRRDYDRSAFGHGWGDTNGDCQDSRAEALISSSTTAVRFSSEQRCRVVSGRWISPFTNRVIQNASDVDIDHVVPLAWAWERGADGWTQVRREAFANDAVNLWPVEASLNRSKAAQGPDQWLPPTGQCGYVARFARVVKLYGLEPRLLESEWIRSFLNGCQS